MLITSFLLRLLGFCLFWDGVLLCSPGWPSTHGSPPGSGIPAMPQHTHLCDFFPAYFTYVKAHQRSMCRELPRTDNILNFFKIPGCLCMHYFLPGPFKLCVLALAELLSNATSVSACHSCLLFVLLKWFGFYEISQWHQDPHIYMDIYLSCSFVICLYF